MWHMLVLAEECIVVFDPLWGWRTGAVNYKLQCSCWRWRLEHGEWQPVIGTDGMVFSESEQDAFEVI